MTAPGKPPNVNGWLLAETVLKPYPDDNAIGAE
jgi:hypothetical protein